MAVAGCPNCGRPLAPGARFCSGCGYSLAAAAPAAPPQPPPAALPYPPAPYPVAPFPAAAYAPAAYGPRPAYAYPLAPAYYAAQQVPRKSHHLRLWAGLVGGLLVVMIFLGSIASLVAPRGGQPGQCGASTCPRPPRQAPPLGAPHVYTSSHYGFQVAYYDHPEFGDALKIAIQDDHQIGWTITSARSGLVYPITIAGQDAGSAGPDAIVDSIQKARYPDAQKAYSIPGLQLGYQNGAGTVYDINIKTGTGSSVHGRLIVAAAIKNGVAITVVVVGPYSKTTPADGHPNPADTPLAGVADDLASNITFKGDRPL